MQVSKIALYKQEGTLKDPEDPLWKILGDRSVAYGKGLGGGGGKYIPGIRKQAPVNDRIVSILNLSTLSNKQRFRHDPNNFNKALSYTTNGYVQDSVTAPHDSVYASRMVDKYDKLLKAREIQFQKSQNTLTKKFNVANPAKKLKDRLGIQTVTKGILFGEFDSFKNWDTRIGLNENLADGRNKMLGYSST